MQHRNAEQTPTKPTRQGRPNAAQSKLSCRSIWVVTGITVMGIVVYVLLMLTAWTVVVDRRSPSAADPAIQSMSSSSSFHLRQEERAPPSSANSKPFAYMFYVTEDINACAALHLMHQLVHNVRVNTTSIDLVVLHSPDASQPMIKRIQHYLDVRFIPVNTILAANTEPTWQKSLTKLQAFRDWGYERVVFLDADSVPLQNLDHLFNLPLAPLYAPRAYWLEQPFFASTLMVIEPSTDRYEAMIQWARVRGKAAGFDMDILNAYFSDTVEYLPGDYTVLNSGFRARPDAKHSLYATTTALKKHTKLVHFSCKPDGSYGKPWTTASRDLSFAAVEGFDPLFAKLFQDFWATEDRYCHSDAPFQDRDGSP